jgi:hypothetical protein
MGSDNTYLSIWVTIYYTQNSIWNSPDDRVEILFNMRLNTWEYQSYFQTFFQLQMLHRLYELAPTGRSVKYTCPPLYYINTPECVAFPHRTHSGFLT